MHQSTKRGRGEKGQALPALVVVLATALVAVVVVARLGLAADEAARARTAADAAALAGATGGQRGAESLADANGGDLIEFIARHDTVEVVVQVGEVRARARAQVSVDWVPSSG